MCGRFVGYRNIDQLRAYPLIDRAACEAAADCNVAPTQKTLSVTRQETLATKPWQ